MLRSGRGMQLRPRDRDLVAAQERDAFNSSVLD